MIHEIFKRGSVDIFDNVDFRKVSDSIKNFAIPEVNNP